MKYFFGMRGYKPFIIYTIVIYLVVFLINKLLGTNYIFNTSFPDFIYNYFPFLNLLPPLVWLILLSIPLLILSYLPVKYLKK